MGIEGPHPFLPPGEEDQSATTSVAAATTAAANTTAAAAAAAAAATPALYYSPLPASAHRTTQGKVRDVMELCGCTQRTAEFYLETAGWDTNLAVSTLMDAGEQTPPRQGIIVPSQRGAGRGGGGGDGGGGGGEGGGGGGGRIRNGGGRGGRGRDRREGKSDDDRNEGNKPLSQPRHAAGTGVHAVRAQSHRNRSIRTAARASSTTSRSRGATRKRIAENRSKPLR